MKKVHRTKEGERMLIANMENEHLINTIKLIGRGMAQLNQWTKSDLMSSALYNLLDMSEEDRILKIQELDDKMGAYVLEATIRDIPYLSGILQEIYGRKEKVPGVETSAEMLLLVSDF